MTLLNDPAPVDPMQQACATLLEVATDRSRYYRWLSLGFYPPEAELYDALRAGSMERELSGAAAWLGNDREQLLPWLDLLADRKRLSTEQIAFDHARLFERGVERVSPCESTYRWRDASAVLQENASLNKELARMYGQFGLSPVEGMQDHVAVELEFMSYLCWRESERWSAFAPVAARELRQQQHNFLDEHLGRWFPEFALRVRQRAEGSFYGVLASLTEKWLMLDLGSGYMGAR